MDARSNSDRERRLRCAPMGGPIDLSIGAQGDAISADAIAARMENQALVIAEP